MGLKSLAAAGATLMLLAVSSAPALACGMPLAARIPAEQALIVFAEGREEIITSVHLESDKPGAAVIFPVPGEPEVSALNSNDLFSYLEEVTRPEVRQVTQVADAERGVPVGGGAPGVSVLGREVIGGYDVARLAAENPGALQEWLDQNGYRAPDGAAPILRGYIDDGWKFVAIKLAADRPANGALAPLRMAFEAKGIVYPMRLGRLSDRPLDVLLYVIAAHRVDILGMETQYAGPIAKLDRPLPTELAPLFRAPFLTKLRNTGIAPASLAEDFVAKTAINDQPYRAVETRTVYTTGSGNSRLSAGPIIGLMLVILSSAVALGVAFGILRRMKQIAGPDPEENDD
jgi:hypothetical protein